VLQHTHHITPVSVCQAARPLDGGVKSRARAGVIYPHYLMCVAPAPYLPVGERALERAGERAVERVGERALERAGERALERAGEQRRFISMTDLHVLCRSSS
jgi:hypothetical protein